MTSSCFVIRFSTWAAPAELPWRSWMPLWLMLSLLSLFNRLNRGLLNYISTALCVTALCMKHPLQIKRQNVKIFKGDFYLCLICGYDALTDWIKIFCADQKMSPWSPTLLVLVALIYQKEKGSTAGTFSAKASCSCTRRSSCLAVIRFSFRSFCDAALALSDLS